jgi:hypothetical protein
MPTYMLMNTLSDKGRKTVKDRPDGIREVNQDLGGMGARVISDLPMMRLPTRGGHGVQGLPPWARLLRVTCRRSPPSRKSSLTRSGARRILMVTEDRSMVCSRQGKEGGCRYEHSSALDIRQSIRDRGR